MTITEPPHPENRGVGRKWKVHQNQAGKDKEIFWAFKLAFNVID